MNYRNIGLVAIIALLCFFAGQASVIYSPFLANLRERPGSSIITLPSKEQTPYCIEKSQIILPSISTPRYQETSKPDETPFPSSSYIQTEQSSSENYTANYLSAPSSPVKSYAMEDISVVIRTYARDSFFVPYLLLSISKFIPSLRSRVTILYPEKDADVVRMSLGKQYDTVRRFELLESNSSPNGGYDEQQFTKLHADLFTESALIMHMDSDCIFNRTVLIGDLVHPKYTSLPWYSYQSYSLLPETLERLWRRSIQFWLGLPEVTYEFMQRFPFVLPREAYQLARTRIALAHGGLSVTDVYRVKKKLISNSQHWISEFNVLGAAAYYHRRDLFAWCVVGVDCPPALAVQMQSTGYNGEGGKLRRTDIDRDFCAAMGLQPDCLP